ncbi:SDR family NAD(P)-dependent oxidoreductase [Streptomyces sp. NPDC000349]|uniref:SDR family NAD(P)-dependent oxidoreductase n=1 Tax=Streptomyces sp. NPDC000349 TaxID=3154249 RepID=UPI00336ADBE2
MPRLIILVTGAGPGIGTQAVHALAEAGHTVYATMRDTTGRNAGRAQELRSYATASDVDIRILELHVSSQESADTAVRSALAEQDHLDAVVHNAAHLGIGVNEAFTDEQVAAIGPHRLNRAVLPHMRAREQGLLLYVGSTTSRMIYPFQGPYEASKAAMDSLAEVTRYEVARYGIDVTVVTPGAVTTGTAHFSEGTRPADGSVADAYGRIAGVEQQIMDRLVELSPPDADPRAVVTRLPASSHSHPASGRSGPPSTSSTTAPNRSTKPHNSSRPPSWNASALLTCSTPRSPSQTASQPAT